MVGGSEFLLILVAVIRNKYLAVQIGPEGFGIYSLLTAFFTYINIVAGSWISNASLKYIAEYNSRNQKNEVNLIISFAFSIVFISVSVLFTVFIIFFPFFKEYFLDEKILFSYYALFAAGFWGTSLSNLMRGALQGIFKITTIVRIRIAIQIFNLLSVLLLVYFFGLIGFFINIALIGLLSAAVYFAELRKYFTISKIRLVWFKEPVIKKTLHFSKIDVFLGFVDQTANFLKRVLVTDLLSIASLGIFTASEGIRRYMGLFTASSLVFFRPQMSQALSAAERNKALNDYARFMTFGGLFSSFVIVIFADSIVKILFSKEFSGLSPILFVFILAQYFQNVLNGYMFTVVGMAKLKIHTAAVLLTTPWVIVFPWFFLNKFGIAALGIGSLIAGLLRIILYAVYLYTKHGVAVKTVNLLLFLSGIALVYLGSILENSFFYVKIISILLLSLFLYLIMNDEEKNIAVKIINKMLVWKR
jgi:PST family polysaccharide transporter